jgi:hypothetical protein
MTDFVRNGAGNYSAKYRDGYRALIENMGSGSWLWAIWKDETPVTMGATGTLKAAKAQANAAAGKITVTRTSAMNGAPVQVALNTPRSCDPSTELYWSM